MQDDDGFILYESRAICRYLEEKYSNQGTKLIPTDLHKRALVDQACWAEAYHFGLHARPICFEHIVRQ
jgi:glutathione S-transferase